MSKRLFKKYNAIIVIHESTTGPGHDLRDYLLENGIHELLFIAHPLLYVKTGFVLSSKYEYYLNGTLVKKHTAVHYSLPESLLYIKDVFYTLWWSLRQKGMYDFYFGIGNLDAFVGILLRMIGKVKKSVYYVIDYVPNRFSSIAINWLYHWIEQFAAEKSDATWNLSPRMIEARERKWGRSFPNQFVVPHGVHCDRIKRVPFEKVNKTEILYMGSLLKKQGIQLVLQAMPEVIKKIPSLQFTIIGRGPFETTLQSLVKDLHLEKYVLFLGYIENHHEMENRIAKAAVAIALYDKTLDDFSYYADPGKVKNYLGAGVPIIMTDVPYVAQQIKTAQCGIVINYDKKELTDFLIMYFSDRGMMERYRKNAVEFARKYEWSAVFANALLPLMQ